MISSALEFPFDFGSFGFRGGGFDFAAAFVLVERARTFCLRLAPAAALVFVLRAAPALPFFAVFVIGRISSSSTRDQSASRGYGRLQRGRSRGQRRAIF